MFVRLTGVLAGAAVLVALSLPAVAAGPASEPVPSVSGPVTLGSRGQPWARAVRSLAPLEDRGYAEEEFFISGTASARDVAAQPTGQSAPFTTRLLVVRPTDPAAFNGTVVVEWINVTAQMDLPIMFGMTRAELLRDGYAYVGVSVQAAGIEGGPLSLKTWDPVRYATLVHPGDAYMHDIFSQAVRSLAAAGPSRPLGDLLADTVLAVGESQSCSTLAQYAAVVQPEHGLVDGFLLHTCATTVTDAIGAPTILLIGESEIDGFTSAAADNQAEFPAVADVPGLGITRLAALGGPPPATDGAFYRVWEVAGGSHYDDQSMDYLTALLGDSVSAPAPGGPVPFPRQGCDGLPFNRLGIERPTAAALHRLARWVTQGEPAPSFDRVERHDDGTIRRDGDGLALGGIQLPPMEVPTGVNVGDDCPFIGSFTAFDASTVTDRCPSRELYLTAFADSVERNVAAGALLPEEGARYLAEAEALDVWGGAAPVPTAESFCQLRAAVTAGSGGGPDDVVAGAAPLPATGWPTPWWCALLFTVAALAATTIRQAGAASRRRQTG